jgi:iron complex transport system substrate-binding protein
MEMEDLILIQLKAHSIKCILLFIVLVLPSSCRTYQLDAVYGTKRSDREVYQGVPERNLTSQCVSDYSPSIDYFPDKTNLSYAKIFNVTYHQHYKVLRLNSSATVQEQTPVSDLLVLVQCGTPPPPLEGELAGATVVEIPVRRIAVNDNCDLANLNRLEAVDRLVAIGGRQIYNDQIREREENKELVAIGYAWHALPNLELALVSKPDVLFMRRATLRHAEAMHEARRLKIAASPTLTRSEPTYLGATEWIKYFALFLNEERKAHALFSEIEKECNAIKDRVMNLNSRPQAIWANYEGGGIWRTARSPKDLRTHYLNDAGALNPLADENALITGRLTTEQLFEIAGEVDYWITENHTTQGWPDENYMLRFKAYRNNQVYHHQKRTKFEIPAYDWYETGSVRPDFVMKDLVAIFHPDLYPGHALLFFDRLSRRKEVG